MVIWATSNAVLSDSGEAVVKSKTYAFPFNVSGLKPNSIYTFYCNSVEMGWACKPVGGKLGDQLLSDDSGKLNLTFMFDLRSSHGYTINNTNSIKSYLTIELRDISNVPTFYYLPLRLRASK